MASYPDSITILFRTMRADTDGLPRCDRSARTLGIRVGTDVLPDGAGLVHPAGGGMSVAVNSVMNLSRARRPKTDRPGGGWSKDPLFSISPDHIEDPLAVHRDDVKHAVIEPLHSMPLERYEHGLYLTRKSWRRHDA